jgi:hypothetical protein
MTITILKENIMVEPRHVYEVLKQKKSYSMGWFDENRTIMLVQIFGPWDFDETLAGVAYMSEVIKSVGHPVYAVFEYTTEYATLIPKEVSIFNMRQLIEYDPPNGQLAIFIRQDAITHTFLTVLHSVVALRRITNKYRFVHTWDEAMMLIEQHEELIAAQA